MVFSKMLTWQYLLTKVTNSRRKFGSRVRRIFLIKKKQKLTKSWPLDWWGCFGDGIKWVALIQRVWVWTLGLGVEAFTLCPAKGSNSYIFWLL